MEVNHCAVLYRPGDVALQVELGRHNDRNVVRLPNVGAPFPHGFFCFLSSNEPSGLFVLGWNESGVNDNRLSVHCFSFEGQGVWRTQARDCIVVFPTAVPSIHSPIPTCNADLHFDDETFIAAAREQGQLTTAKMILKWLCPRGTFSMFFFCFIFHVYQLKSFLFFVFSCKSCFCAHILD